MTAQEPKDPAPPDAGTCDHCGAPDKAALVTDLVAAAMRLAFANGRRPPQAGPYACLYNRDRGRYEEFDLSTQEFTNVPCNPRHDRPGDHRHDHADGPA